MKNSEIEGRPILQLPPKDIELVKLKFSPDEKAVSAGTFVKNGF
jgi:hypothetical protein